jgi:hypothetical protein
MSSTTFSGPVTSTNGFIGDVSGPTVADASGAGITDGTGASISTDISKVGKVINTQIVIDVTGLGSSTTDLDIIGSGASAAYLTEIDYATMGQLFAVSMTCLEAPVTGVTDVDLYSATEDTGVFDTAIGDLVEVIVITGGAAWTLNKVNTATPATNIPVDGKFLYLTCGAAGTPAVYTAGIFMIEMWGYEA